MILHFIWKIFFEPKKLLLIAKYISAEILICIHKIFNYITPLLLLLLRPHFCTHTTLILLMIFEGCRHLHANKCSDRGKVQLPPPSHIIWQKTDHTTNKSINGLIDKYWLIVDFTRSSSLQWGYTDIVPFSVIILLPFFFEIALNRWIGSFAACLTIQCIVICPSAFSKPSFNKLEDFKITSRFSKSWFQKTLEIVNFQDLGRFRKEKKRGRRSCVYNENWVKKAHCMPKVAVLQGCP